MKIGRNRLIAALVSTAKHDVLVRLAAGFFALSVVAPLALRAVGVAPPRRLFLLGATLVLLPLVVVSLTWRLRNLERSWERSYWRRLAWAYGFWFVGLAFPWAFPELPGPLPPSSVEVVLSALFYLLFLRAVERRPHLPSPPPQTGRERLLTWPAVTFFVFGLTIYFVFIPLAIDSQAAVNELAEVYFYALVDLYMAVRLFFLSRVAKTRRWRTIYTALALPWIVILSADLSFLIGSGWDVSVAPWMLGNWWNLSFVLHILAVRLRHHPFGRERQGDADHPVVQVEEPSFVVSARTLALGVVFPVLHIAVYRFELLDLPSRGAREGLVLLWLIAFGVIALVQHRLLERQAQKLWLDRLSFEEEMRSSEQDLRLIIERDRETEALQASDQRFILAFHACPYPLTINNLSDGTFVEVNPAFERTFGHPREQAVGRTAEDLALWADRGDLKHVNRLIAAGHEVRDLEILFHTQSKDPRLTLFSAATIELAGKRCLLSTLHDVTTQRAAEKRLEATAALVDDARGAVFEIDSGGRVSYWNRGAERLTGRPEEEVLGQPVREVLADDEGAALLQLGERSERCGEIALVGSGGARVRATAWCIRVGASQPPSRLVVTA